MYCNYCGKPLGPGEVCTCQQNQPSQYAPVYGGYPTTEPASPAVAVLRKHGSSVLTLLVAVLTLAGVIFGIISTVVSTGTIFGAVEELLYSYGYSYYDSSAYSVGMIVGSIVGAIVGNILNFLLVAALFMCWKASKNPVDSYIKTSGLTIFKVIGIISIVDFAILIALCLLFAVIILAIGSEMSFELSYLMADYGMAGGALITILAVVFLLCAGACVFGLVLQVAFVRTVNSLKSSCITGAPALKISMFYIVMLIVSAVFGLLSSFTGVIAFLAGGCSAAASIIGAVLLLRVRREMIEIAMGTQPVYPAPPVYQDAQQSFFTEPSAPTYPEPQPPVAESEPETPAPKLDEVFQNFFGNGVQENAAESPAEDNNTAQPANVICPFCGEVYSSEANFCIHCGGKNPNK